MTHLWSVHHLHIVDVASTSGLSSIVASCPCPPRRCSYVQGLPAALQHPVAVAGLFQPFGDVLDVKL